MRSPFFLVLVVFSTTLALVGFGLISVYSASGPEHGWFSFRSQLTFAIIGLAGMLLAYLSDYNQLRRWSFWIMIITFIMCLLVYVPGIGVSRNGAHRWIRLGMQFQPSEFAKLGLVLYMAKMLEDRQRSITNWFSGLLPAAFLTLIFCGVILLEPDFGAALVLGAAIFCIWLIADIPWYQLMIIIAVLVPLGYWGFHQKEYRGNRTKDFITYWLDRESVTPDMYKGSLYQLNQSLIAVGAGGVKGVGLGNGFQRQFLMVEAKTDYIFSTICEELGFIGASIVVGLYFMLIAAGWWIAYQTNDIFGCLLATGIIMLIGVSVIINIAVVTALFPTKGLVLPLLSYGGSSLIVTMINLGILMNIARNIYAPRPLDTVRPLEIAEGIA